MKIKPLTPNFKLPVRGTDKAGGYDLFMPEAGIYLEGEYSQPVTVPLGFAAEVPEGHVALLLPRSGVGTRYGTELNNTCGVIDPDYRGEWLATIRTKDGKSFSWSQGERVLQMVIVPVLTPELEIVDSLNDTQRGAGGFGSTGK